MTSGCVDAVPQEPSVRQFRACSARLCTPIRHKFLPQLAEVRFLQTQTGARRAVESGRWTQKRFLPTSELCKSGGQGRDCGAPHGSHSRVAEVQNSCERPKSSNGGRPTTRTTSLYGESRVQVSCLYSNLRS